MREIIIGEIAYAYAIMIVLDFDGAVVIGVITVGESCM